MLHEHHRMSAPSASSVSIRTAVWIVMCSDPAMRAPLSGWLAANSSRVAIRPGISVWARSARRISSRQLWNPPPDPGETVARANRSGVDLGLALTSGRRRVDGPARRPAVRDPRRAPRPAPGRDLLRRFLPGVAGDGVDLLPDADDGERAQRDAAPLHAAG